MRLSRIVLAVVAMGAFGGGAIALRPAAPPAANSIERLAAYQDPALLARAWALPVARLYGPDGFVYQRNPSICGPTSLANVLHSEGRSGDPVELLAGTGIFSIFGLLPRGLTLDQEAGLISLRLGGKVTTLRGLSLDQFRAEMAKANDPAHRLIVNFTRAPLFGRGHGHFSPVLGYLADKDLVFVGDVNRNYRPWLVPTARLYEAQAGVDPDSSQSRGVLEVDAPAPGA